MLRATAAVIATSAALLLSACGTAPVTTAEAASPAYRTDLASCRESVPTAVDKRNAKTGLAWMTSPLTRWPEIDHGIDACMNGKGWGQMRACTPAELREGNRDPHLVVTELGVRCVDPGRRS